MNESWHELIPRYVEGRTTPEEAAGLESALRENAELRAWYLDYLNLDTALTDLASRAQPAAGAPVPFPARRWRWIAASAAAAMIALAGVLSLRTPPPPPPQTDIAAALAATEGAIARLSVQRVAGVSFQTSPTDSLLRPPQLPQ